VTSEFPNSKKKSFRGNHVRKYGIPTFRAKNIGRLLLFILSCLYYMMNWAPSFLIHYVNQVEIGTPPSKTGYLWNPSELPDLRGHGLGQLHTTTPPVDKTEKLWVGLKMFERTVCWGKFKWYVKFRPKDYLPKYESCPYRSIIIKNENLRKSVIYYELSNIFFTVFHSFFKLCLRCLQSI